MEVRFSTLLGERSWKSPLNDEDIDMEVSEKDFEIQFGFKGS